MKQDDKIGEVEIFYNILIGHKIDYLLKYTLLYFVIIILSE